MKETDSGRAGAVYLEPSVGALFLMSDSYWGENYGNGLETGVDPRYMFTDRFGAALGVLFGVSNGITIGANGYFMLYLTERIGLGAGFQGSPIYLNYFGGPSAYVAVGNLSFRLATNILGVAPSTSFGVGYSIRM